VTLAATFTATYPKTPPILSFKDYGSLRDSTKFKLQKIIETKPKELTVGEEAMIMEIVSLLVQCGFSIPSSQSSRHI